MSFDSRQSGGTKVAKIRREVRLARVDDLA
jgi:hypothetical protein